MRRSKAAAALSAIALLGLAGCDKLGLPGGNSTGQSSLSEADQGKKLDSYIEGYNALLDSGGLERQAKDYRESDIPNGAPGGEFRVSAGWINQGLDKLRAARVMGGGSSALDAAADTVLASTGKVQTHLESLESYYSGKKYLDDKFARGKAENAPMLAEIDTAEKDLAAFGKLLDGAIEQRDAVQLDKIKGSNPVGYNVKLALIHAKKLLRLFDGQTKPAQPDLLAKGDVEVAAIEQAIADGKAAASKAGQATPRAFDTLNAMLGYYREFKQDHDPDHLNTVVTYYNGAVNDANN